MVCRKGELRDAEERAVAAALSDAVLFTMMCIVGLPVDVHVKDSSVYSGIFHTASLHDDYAIVLKKARMIKKGSLEANVVSGTLIETLVIQSEDLVQVVAKGVPLPSDGIRGYVDGDDIEATAGRSECLNLEVEAVENNKFNRSKKQMRVPGKKGNGYPYNSSARTANFSDNSAEDHNERLNALKIEDVHYAAVDGRQVLDSSEEKQKDRHNKHDLQDQRTQSTTTEVQGSSPAKETYRQQTPNEVSPGQERSPLDTSAFTAASLPTVSVDSVPAVTVKSNLGLSASSDPFLLAPSKSSSFNRTAKESKLNPGAELFSPSMLHCRTVTPPAVPNEASVSYMPAAFATAPIATGREEVDASSFAPSSVPVKIVPYNNAALLNGGNDAPYVQPIIGQAINRAPPFRYSGQYHMQPGHAFVHPNLHNVMYGRAGPLVCVHPILSDVVQSAAPFPPVIPRPHLIPHQVHMSKQQGNAPPHPLQLCMTPPSVASGSQAFVMPNSIPNSQPVFPVLRPIAVPGSNAFLSNKFA